MKLLALLALLCAVLLVQSEVGAKAVRSADWVLLVLIISYGLGCYFLGYARGRRTG